MLNTNTSAINAHRQAAADHAACAQHHSIAAQCYEQNKLDEAKTSAKNALGCCEAASKHSAEACGNAPK